MRRANKSWMAVVAAALLLGTLVGMVWARPSDRPGAADITRKVTLTGGEFIVHDDGYDWHSNGAYVECTTNSCGFVAPVVFPCLPSVTVERIQLHVLDSNPTLWAEASLYRAKPANGADVLLGTASSPVGTAGHQPWSSDPINKVVWPSQRAYIWLSIGGPNIKVYGVTVEYHRNI